MPAERCDGNDLTAAGTSGLTALANGLAYRSTSQKHLRLVSKNRSFIPPIEVEG